MRRKRTSVARSSLLLPFDLTDSESPSKHHRGSRSAMQMLTIVDVETVPPTPCFDATPADFNQFTLPPELHGIIVDHQVPPERNRKVYKGPIILFVSIHLKFDRHCRLCCTTGLHCIPHFCTKLLSVKLHQIPALVLYTADP